MRWKNLRGAMALGAMIACLAGGAIAQQAEPPPLVLKPLAANVYWTSDGSNIGVIVGDKGVVVFDTGRSPARAKELLAAIAKITPKPVDTVIISHQDFDHVAGLAGFPAGIRVIAQENTQKALAAATAAGKGQVPQDHLPNHAVKDREDAVLDGVKVQLLHWGPAHTDGDLVAYLPDQKIVFAGDIFCMDQARAFIHLAEGGSTQGWISVANAVLKLDADKIVVGHGGVDNKVNLAKFIAATAVERDQVKALVAKGVSLEQIKVDVKDPPGSATAPPHFVGYAETVYDELTGKK